MSTPLLVVVRRLARYYSRSLRCWYFNTVWGMDIGKNCIISYKARLDKSYPRGIHIGRDSAVTFGAAVLTHDYLNDVHLDTWIGERCLVGAHAIVFPGVHIGDGSIVAAGSVVMKDISRLPRGWKSSPRLRDRHCRWTIWQNTATETRHVRRRSSRPRKGLKHNKHGSFGGTIRGMKTQLSADASPSTELYIDLLKRSLTNTVFGDEPDVNKKNYVAAAIIHYQNGPAISMLPLVRLDNLESA